MKGSYLLIVFTLFFAKIFAQVGIGTININPSSLLALESNNKGLLFPKLNIPDLNNPSPTVNPKNGLLAYNSFSNDGFVYWDTNKWNYIIDSKNVASILGLTISVTSVNSSSLILTKPTSALSYNIGSSPGEIWNEIPGLSKEIEINKTNNIVSIQSEGAIQSNNTGVSGYSYAIAIFINNKLFSVRNFVSTSQTACTYDYFSINSIAKNLPIGKNTIKTYATIRVNFESGTTTSWTVGGKSNNCTNISDKMAECISIIKITQKEN